MFFGIYCHLKRKENAVLYQTKDGDAILNEPIAKG